MLKKLFLYKFMANKNLTNTKKAKNDEFYTQYSDIQKEIEAYLEYNPDVFRGKITSVPLKFKKL